MRPDAAEVRPAVDLVAIKQAWAALDKREAKTLGEIRLERGRLLMQARKAFPMHGSKAKGWSELLAEWGIEERTARNYMTLAGYVSEKVSETPAQSPPEVPTYREAGVIKDRPARAEPPVQPAPTPPPPRQQQVAHCNACLKPMADGLVHCRNCDRHTPAGKSCEFCDESTRGAKGAKPGPPPPPPTDEEREEYKIARIRERQPPPMETRAEQAATYLVALADAECAMTRTSFHLTDVSTSPEEFERAKKMLISIVRRGLDELDAAGVLDEAANTDTKNTKRQLSLLKGGLA